MAKPKPKPKQKAAPGGLPAPGPDAKAPSWPAYTVERRPIAWLKAAPRNARTHSAAQVEQLRASLKSFGWTIPCLAREDGTLIAGHGRVEAAKLEGLTEAPVIVATGWTEEQCRAYALADNRIALNAGWDEELLGLELKDLDALGVDLASLGFAPAELNDLLGSKAGLTDPDDVPEPPAQPVSRLGDLWNLGKHRLLCGDSTKAEDVTRVLGDVKPHLMVTDPPYGVSYDPTWSDGGITSHRFVNAKARGAVTNDDRCDWRDAWALFPGSVVYCWHSGTRGSKVQESLEAAGFEIAAQIIWAKARFAISRGNYHWQHEPCWYAVRKGKNHEWSGSRSQTTLWSIEHQKSETGHGTQKPVECMKRPIENNSSPGQAVYEPFSGSGTTIIAGEMTGRSVLALEIDPAYIDVAVSRWQEFTGFKATLDGDGRDFEMIAAERVKVAA